MRTYLSLFLVLIFAVSCKNDEPKELETNKIDVKKEYEITSNKEKLDSLVMENGIKIHWLNRGQGDSIVTGDCVDIEYKVFLSNGKLVEGNHLLNIASFPFVVGFEMQTKGWDIALQKMRAGDEVEIFIPSKLARGEKGAGGMIPPNSDNIVYINVLSKRKPTREIDGTRVYVFEENLNNKLKFNKENTLTFHAMISTPSNPMYFNSFRTNKPFTAQMKHAGLVPGLKKALNNAKKSDRMYVVIPSEEGYGAQGYLDLVKSNEPLLFNIFVMDVF